MNKYLFNFKNDWVILHKESGSFANASYNGKPEGGLTFWVYLEYSKSRNKFRITTSKNKLIPHVEDSDTYQNVLDRKIKLEKDNNLKK